MPKGSHDRERSLAGVNPLAWSLGQFIKEARKELRLSSDLLAQELDLRPSSYRVVEAGGAPLQPRYIRRLIYALTPSQHIYWPRLASLLVATLLFEEKGPDGSETPSLVEALARFANDEPLASPLVDVLIEAIEAGRSRHSDQTLQRAAVEGVRVFLTQHLPESGTRFAAPANVLWDLVAECDPILLDQQLRVAYEMSRVRLTFESASLDDWEQLNASRFTRVIGLLVPESVTPTELSSFGWPFLRPPNVRPCSILLWKGDTSSSVQTILDSLPEQVRASGNVLPRTVKVHALGSEHRSILEKAFQEIPTPADAHHNYWCYEMAFGSPRTSPRTALAIATRDNRNSDPRAAEVMGVAQSQKVHAALLELLEILITDE